MRVLFDYQAFCSQNYGGVSNSFVKLISNMPDGVDCKIALCECDNIHLKESGLLDVGPMEDLADHFLCNRHFVGQSFLYRRYSELLPSRTSLGRNRLCSVQELKKGEFDVFHPTYFDDYFLRYLNRKPFVLTVHDMIPELFFPKWDSQVRRKPLLCQKASHIVTVSNKTKQDLIDILNVPEEKITVIYHGAPEYNLEEFSAPIIEGKYILYVGQRNSYKCFYPMIRSLASVLKRHQDLKIVCTGPSFSEKEKRSMQKLGVYNQLIHLRVNDRDLYNLYSHALCFIYPSMYEGFGIPILEAYRAHCPVLLNQASCFPEIAQDAAIYFNLDQNSSNLDVIIEKFLTLSPKERGILINKQNLRLQFFSWRKSAQELKNVYESLV